MCVLPGSGSVLKKAIRIRIGEKTWIQIHIKRIQIRNAGCRKVQYLFTYSSPDLFVGTVHVNKTP